MTSIECNVGKVRHGTGVQRRELALTVMLAASVVVGPAHAQGISPLARIRSLGLDTAQVGRVTVYFADTDRERAVQLGALASEAASYYSSALEVSFPLHLAVLSPADWFDPYAEGEPTPYGSPWGWVPDLLMAVPASVDEGVLILGPDQGRNARRIQFVMLHEYGHLANKRYLHPESVRQYSAVRWFEEYLATYFAYAFWESVYPSYAAASRAEWAAFVESYRPPVLSLDWTFMQSLSPEEYGQTYAWYQMVLNLRAADVFREEGLDFLRRVRDEMAWESSAEWTTRSVLASVERIAPGFGAWAEALQNGEYGQASGR